jgi:flagellum-specific ATP synthase
LTPEPIDLAPYFARLETIDPFRRAGVVVGMVGLIIESRGPGAAIGDFCQIETSGGGGVRTQVIGFRDGNLLSMPLEETGGLRLGDPVVARSQDARVEVGEALLGRVLDGFGRPLDGGPPLDTFQYYDLFHAPASPLEREHITEPLTTGIRAIDSLLPCGAGQRIGIFGGSGVGKSTLLASMARNHGADVTVIAMIGERNREVRAFIEQELGDEARKRAVLVTATSDQPAPLRVRACFVAVAVAEYFRDRGAKVLLVVDSVTRLAMAQREIGLAGGSRPARRAIRPRFFTCSPRSSSAPGISGKARSPGSSRCWWKATISTSLFAMRSAAFWTATSCCRAGWETPGTIRPSTSCNRSAGSRRAWPAKSSRRPRAKSAKPWPYTSNRKI